MNNVRRYKVNPTAVPQPASKRWSRRSGKLSTECSGLGSPAERSRKCSLLSCIQFTVLCCHDLLASTVLYRSSKDYMNRFVLNCLYEIGLSPSDSMLAAVALHIAAQ